MSELTNIHARAVKDLTTPTELPVEHEALEQVKLVAGNFPTEYAGNEALTVKQIKDLTASDLESKVEVTLSNLSTTANKFYPTLAEANSHLATMSVNAVVTIGEEANKGLWYKATAEATTLTKSAYDPLTQANNYTNNKTIVAKTEAVAIAKNYTDLVFDAVPTVIAPYVAQAEAAATAATISAGVFETPEAGVDPTTGVKDGEYFNVRSPSSDSYIDEYQNIGGSAIATGKSYLSALGVQQQEKPANTIKDARGKTQQDINDSVGAKWYAKGGGYPINYRVMLNNGDIVKSTIDGNTNDPNTDLTGWLNLSSASAILDESGKTQQEINNGVASLDELRLINPETKGRKLYLNSVIVGKDLGGGMFVSTQKAGLSDNGGTVIASSDPKLFWVRVNYDNVIPQFWGALGDGVNDDRPAFQAAINYLHTNGGGELFLPKPTVRYQLKSYDATESAALVIPRPLRSMYVDPISIRGAANLTEIVADLGVGVLIDAGIKLKGSGLYKKFENLNVWGGPSSTTKNCKRILDGWEGWHPNLTIRDCRFYSATEDCVRLATYVSVLDKVQTAYSPIGVRLEAPNSVDAPVTAITMNSCYGLNHTRHAMWAGQLTYSTINSHAADHIINDVADGYEAYPYYIDIARGVTINGLGAESSTRILKVRSAQGLTIHGIMTLSIGDNANPPDNLIRMDGGSSAVIGGVHLQNPKAYGKILSLGSTFAKESVTVLDDSIPPNKVSYVPHYGNERPIFFVTRQLSRKTQTITLTNSGNAETNTTNLNNAVQAAYDLELLHDVVINFPSGTFEISGLTYLVSSASRGSGRVRLVGHSDGTSKVLATGNGGIYFGRPDNLARMSFTIEKLELQIGAVSGNNKAFAFDGSITSFIGGKLTSDNLARQYYANPNATLRLDANSAILTPVYVGGNVEFTYKAASAPTNSTRLPVGTIFKASDPNATRIGWINTSDNGASWLALTA